MLSVVLTVTWERWTASVKRSVISHFTFWTRCYLCKRVLSFHISHFLTRAQQEVFSYGEYSPSFQVGTFVLFKVMWHCTWILKFQLSSYTLTSKHHLYVRALLNRSLRAHSAQQKTQSRRYYDSCWLPSKENFEYPKFRNTMLEYLLAV